MGIYKEMVNRIKTRQERGELVVLKTEIVEGIDVSEMPRDELERRCIMATASCAFNACGFRSLSYGSGAFVDETKVDNPFALFRLSKNASTNAEKRQVIASCLQKKYESVAENEAGYRQMYFDETGMIMPEPTDEEIIEMLKAESV